MENTVLFCTASSDSYFSKRKPLIFFEFVSNGTCQISYFLMLFSSCSWISYSCHRHRDRFKDFRKQTFDTNFQQHKFSFLIEVYGTDYVHKTLTVSSSWITWSIESSFWYNVVSRNSIRCSWTSKVIKLVKKTEITKNLPNASKVVLRETLFYGTVCIHKVILFLRREASFIKIV